MMTTPTQITALINEIPPLDAAAMRAARDRQALLTKPRGSLGRLEALAVQIAGITGQARPHLEHKVILVMAADHGVVAEGVSAYPQEVTAQMVANILKGGAAINVLARQVGARILVADLGVAVELPEHPDLINARVAPGTANLAAGPAMSRSQAVAAIMAGSGALCESLEVGLDILCTGEMGIGNTTPSAAIAAAITGEPPAELAGRGAGIDEIGLQRKISAIHRSLARNQPDRYDGLDVLSKVGGFEIGGLAGAILTAAANRRPVIIDGFISTAAAMIAATLAPQVRPYLIASHASEERGHQRMLAWLGITPLLDLGLRLGEGTGAALALSLVEAACKTLDEMATFDEAGVSTGA